MNPHHRNVKHLRNGGRSDELWNQSYEFQIQQGHQQDFPRSYAVRIAELAPASISRKIRFYVQNSTQITRMQHLLQLDNRVQPSSIVTSCHYDPRRRTSFRCADSALHGER